jgi:hypothetical protein
MLRERWNRYKDLNLNLLVRSQASYPLDDNDIEPTQGFEPCSPVYKTGASTCNASKAFVQVEGLEPSSLLGSSF